MFQSMYAFVSNSGMHLTYRADEPGGKLLSILDLNQRANRLVASTLKIAEN
jgi:hypothetical protein